MQRVWTGRDTLLTLLATFGVIFAVNFYFLGEAIHTYPGEDVSHPYLQGNEFNQAIADRARQAKLGWSATIGAAREKDGSVVVQVVLRDRDGKPVTNEALAALLRHPMDEQLDKPITLKETAPGLYTDRLMGIRAGQWDIIARRKNATEAPFEAERRLFVP